MFATIFKVRAALVAIMFFILMAMLGCNRGPSSSDVEKALGLPRTIYYCLPVARVSAGSCNIFGPTWQDYLKVWNKLQSRGYIIVKRLGKASDGLFSWDRAEITLTEKGREIFTHYKQHFWKVPVCRKVLVRFIIRSLNQDSNLATVQYTYRFEPISNVAEVVKPISDIRGLAFNKVYSATIVMSKSRDGWKVESDPGRIFFHSLSQLFK